MFCPKVLAGIGTLPETVADRSIPIRLERRTADERLQPFRRREVGPAGEALWRRADSWAEQHAEALRKARPQLPEALSDRQKDGAEILVAIADRLGYGAQARAALVELLTSERLDDQESMRLRLLRDIKAIFDANPKRRAVFTKTLIAQLYANEEAGWSSYYARGLDPKDLASLLKHYGIHSTTVRGSKDAAPSKGYKRDDFIAAWERYLS